MCSLFSLRSTNQATFLSLSTLDAISARTHQCILRSFCSRAQKDENNRLTPLGLCCTPSFQPFGWECALARSPNPVENLRNQKPERFLLPQGTKTSVPNTLTLRIKKMADWFFKCSVRLLLLHIKESVSFTSTPCRKTLYTTIGFAVSVPLMHF